MKYLIIPLIVVFTFISCDKNNGNNASTNPYARPFPKRLYYDGILKRSFNVDSNQRMTSFTYHLTNSNDQDYTIVYDSQGRMDSVKRTWNGQVLGTYFQYYGLDSMGIKRIASTNQYEYRVRYNEEGIQKMYLMENSAQRYNFEMKNDSITWKRIDLSLTPAQVYREEIYSLSDSISPLYLKENPLFSWYYLWVLDPVFSARMPDSETRVGASESSYFDNTYDSYGRLIERKARLVSGTYTLELEY